jgi:hypothetical protein
MSLLTGLPDSTFGCKSALVDKLGVSLSQYHHIVFHIADLLRMNNGPVEAEFLRCQSHPIIANPRRLWLSACQQWELSEVSFGKDFCHTSTAWIAFYFSDQSGKGTIRVLIVHQGVWLSSEMNLLWDTADDSYSHLLHICSTNPSPNMQKVGTT